MLHRKLLALSTLGTLTLLGCSAEVGGEGSGDDGEGTTDSAEIRGGDKTSAPSWMVSIQWRPAFGGSWRHLCGGVLYRANYVATAAHCIETYIMDPTMEIRVCVGATRLSECTTGNTSGIIHSRTHSNRSALVSEQWDAGVIKLQRSFSNGLAALASAAEDPPAGANVQALGWGKRQDGSFPDTLHTLTYPVVSNAACHASWNGRPAIYSTQLCADATTSRGTCNGDSGGPLVYNGRIVGLTSYGWNQNGVCTGGADDVYTRVSSVRSWILNPGF
jgi:secreted trypsin-like serine protease